jgi:hypothetical protein
VIRSAFLVKPTDEQSGLRTPVRERDFCIPKTPSRVLAGVSEITAEVFLADVCARRADKLLATTSCGNRRDLVC